MDFEVGKRYRLQSETPLSNQSLVLNDLVSEGFVFFVSKNESSAGWMKARVCSGSCDPPGPSSLTVVSTFISRNIGKAPFIRHIGSFLELEFLLWYLKVQKISEWRVSQNSTRNLTRGHDPPREFREPGAV